MSNMSFDYYRIDGNDHDDDNEENIRNLIKKEEIYEKQEFNYKSKFAEKIKKDYAKVKKHHQTMGYAQIPLRSPQEYLKKYSRINMIKTIDHHCLGRHSPRRTHPGAIYEDEIKNKENESKRKIDFIKKNTQQIQKLQPNIRNERKVIDAPDGHSQNDMHPVYVFRKTFGKTPKYIIKRKHEFIEQQKTSPYPDEHKTPFCQISEEDRRDILKGLKNYWSELQKEFQTLPLKIDTETLKKRKSNLENKLRQIEKDIELIEKHEYIYVTN